MNRAEVDGERIERGDLVLVRASGDHRMLHDFVIRNHGLTMHTEFGWTDRGHARDRQRRYLCVWIGALSRRRARRRRTRAACTTARTPISNI